MGKTNKHLDLGGGMRSRTYRHYKYFLSSHTTFILSGHTYLSQHTLPYQPEISLLHIYSSDIKTQITQKPHPQNITAGLYIITKNQKKHKGLNGRMKIQTMLLVHPHAGTLLSDWQLKNQFSAVQFSHSVVSDSLQPHESQHARPPCPSPTPGVHSDSHPLSQ